MNWCQTTLIVSKLCTLSPKYILFAVSKSLLSDFQSYLASYCRLKEEKTNFICIIIELFDTLDSVIYIKTILAMIFGCLSSAILAFPNNLNFWTIKKQWKLDNFIWSQEAKVLISNHYFFIFRSFSLKAIR